MLKQTAESFWAKVDTTGDCWLWTRNTDADGYGRVRWHGKYVRAHRLAYTLTHGDPGDKMVCHRCDNPTCVRPEHLFTGDNSLNMRDSVEKGRHGESGRTHCDNGHEWTARNTGVNRKPDGTAVRRCNDCQRDAYRRRTGC
jgi:hypothetical protein